MTTINPPPAAGEGSMSAQYFNQTINQNLGIAAKRATKSEVVALAKEHASAEIHLKNLQTMNMPTDIEKHVEARAALQIAYDKVTLAKAAYDAAFKSWAAGGYVEA
jgi:hypothetical protein